MNTWRFSALVAKYRRVVLEAAPSFADIAHSVAQTMRIHCAHVDWCDEAPGHRRIVCCGSVDRGLFDVFFNSLNGYRGRYFESPEFGLAANALLLGLLAPNVVDDGDHSDMPKEMIDRSMRQPSAKCWLAEVGKGFCPQCIGEWTTPQDDAAEILNGRWEVGTGAHRRYGRKAPVHERLRVMGAYINDHGEEYVPLRKRTRAQQIHNDGWS